MPGYFFFRKLTKHSGGSEPNLNRPLPDNSCPPSPGLEETRARSEKQSGRRQEYHQSSQPTSPITMPSTRANSTRSTIRPSFLDESALIGIRYEKTAQGEAPIPIHIPTRQPSSRLSRSLSRSTTRSSGGPRSPVIIIPPQYTQHAPLLEHHPALRHSTALAQDTWKRDSGHGGGGACSSTSTTPTINEEDCEHDTLTHVPSVLPVTYEMRLVAAHANAQQQQEEGSRPMTPSSLKSKAMSDLVGAPLPASPCLTTRPTTANSTSSQQQQQRPQTSAEQMLPSLLARSPMKGLFKTLSLGSKPSSLKIETEVEKGEMRKEENMGEKNQGQGKGQGKGSINRQGLGQGLGQGQDQNQGLGEMPQPIRHLTDPSRSGSRLSLSNSISNSNSHSHSTGTGTNLGLLVASGPATSITSVMPARSVRPARSLQGVQVVQALQPVNFKPVKSLPMVVPTSMPLLPAAISGSSGSSASSGGAPGSVSSGVSSGSPCVSSATRSPTPVTSITTSTSTSTTSQSTGSSSGTDLSNSQQPLQGLSQVSHAAGRKTSSGAPTTTFWKRAPLSPKPPPPPTNIPRPARSPSKLQLHTEIPTSAVTVHDPTKAQPPASAKVDTTTSTTAATTATTTTLQMQTQKQLEINHLQKQPESHMKSTATTPTKTPTKTTIITTSILQSSPQSASPVLVASPLPMDDVEADDNFDALSTSFSPLSVAIPTEKLLDDGFMTGFSFSNRGSVMYAGKRALKFDRFSRNSKVDASSGSGSGSGSTSAAADRASSNAHSNSNNAATMETIASSPGVSDGANAVNATSNSTTISHSIDSVTTMSNTLKLPSIDQVALDGIAEARSEPHGHETKTLSTPPSFTLTAEPTVATRPSTQTQETGGSAPQVQSHHQPQDMQQLHQHSQQRRPITMPLPDIRVLPAEIDRESQKVRSLYAVGDSLNWEDGAVPSLGNRIEATIEEASPEEETNDNDPPQTRFSQATTEAHLSHSQLSQSLSTPLSISADSASSLRPESYNSNNSNNTKDPKSAAGGYEDWDDLEGVQVDRYGFITEQPSRPVSSRLGSPTTLHSTHFSPRRRNLLQKRDPNSGVRPPSRKVSARSLHTQNSGRSLSSLRSTRSVLRQATNLLPHNRDRKWMDEAGDMLTVAPNLQDIAEEARVARISESLKRKEWERAEKWRKMAKNTKKGHLGEGMEFEFDVKNPKLIERAWKGIPDRWRASAWWSFMAASAKGREDSPSEREITAAFHLLQERSSPDDVQIDLDVPRTISRHIMFRKRYAGGQRLLFRVLHALSIYFPETGYVQGMASLAATLLCYFDEEKCFVMLVRMWQLRGLDRLYGHGFEGLMTALKEFETAWLNKDVSDKLLELGIDATAYGTRWYLTLFNLSIPFAAQLRVWDVFLLLGDIPDTPHPQSRTKKATAAATTSTVQPTGLDILHATSAALIQALRELLLDSDFENAMKALTSFIPISDEDLLMKVTKAEWKTHQSKKKT